MYMEYDLLFHILVLPEQMKNKCHLKNYSLLVSGPGCVISGILTHSITKSLALMAIYLLVSFIHCERKAIDKLFILAFILTAVSRLENIGINTVKGDKSHNYLQKKLLLCKN